MYYKKNELEHHVAYCQLNLQMCKEPEQKLFWHASAGVAGLFFFY